MNVKQNATPRRALTRERVLQAAVDLADRDGLGALTMRRLGAEVGVEAMSLYKHVTNKDDILDGIIEVVIGEIEIPSEGDDWRSAMRRRALSAREVLGRHSWAVGLMESRNSKGPVVLGYLDATLASLRAGGFSIENAGYAFTVLDSYVYGHIIQETSLSFDTPEDLSETTAAMLDQAANDYPHLAEIGAYATTSGFTLDAAFEFGLELILDALERLR